MRLIILLAIERIAKEVIPRDFEGDESLFAKLGSLYNEAQTRSVDAFSLRDLALQSAVRHGRRIQLCWMLMVLIDHLATTQHQRCR